MVPTVQILGVPIACLTIDEAVEHALEGGLVLAPSGPGLCDLERDPDYRDALLGSDVNLTDSGLVVLVEALRSRRKLPRASGLGYFEALLARPELRPARTTFWVMPSEAAMERNLAWLRSHGLDVTRDDCYIAPIYPRHGRVEDATLAALVEERVRSMSSSVWAVGPRRSLACFSRRSSRTSPAFTASARRSPS